MDVFYGKVDMILSAMRSIPFPELTSLEIICFTVISFHPVDDKNLRDKTLEWLVKGCLMPKLETITVKCE